MCGGTILLKYMLPQLIGPLAVTAVTQLGTALVDIAGLSFLGIGVQEPQAEWGSMINQARAYIQLNPWPVLAPAAATVLTVMLLNRLGDCVRDCAAGESGCGKSTLLRTLMGADDAAEVTAGTPIPAA